MNLKEAKKAMDTIQLYNLICDHGDVIQIGSTFYKNNYGFWRVVDYTDTKPLTKEQIKLKQRKR